MATANVLPELDITGPLAFKVVRMKFEEEIGKCDDAFKKWLCEILGIDAISVKSLKTPPAELVRRAYTQLVFHINDLLQAQLAVEKSRKWWLDHLLGLTPHGAIEIGLYREACHQVEGKAMGTTIDLDAEIGKWQLYKSILPDFTWNAFAGKICMVTYEEWHIKHLMQRFEVESVLELKVAQLRWLRTVWIPKNKKENEADLANFAVGRAIEGSHWQTSVVDYCSKKEIPAVIKLVKEMNEAAEIVMFEDMPA